MKPPVQFYLGFFFLFNLHFFVSNYWVIFFSAARITTAQTSELGSHIAYMQKLLAIVRTKKQERSIDVTLKYTLSALWNLTDESPMTCQVFLVEGGMDLFIEVLDTFPGDKCIETKVLGLLNNIAEVPHLRSNLLKDQFLANLRYVILFEISSQSQIFHRKIN